jgi:hypothetical protein
MTFQVAFTIWVILLALVAAAAAYRYWMDHRHEHETIHLHDADAPVVAEQMTIARKLHWVDVWGKTLTIAAVVYGVALGAFYVYTEFQRQGSGAIIGR